MIQPFENAKIYKEVYGHLDAVRHSVRMAIHLFVNFDVWEYYESWCALSDYVDQ